MAGYFILMAVQFLPDVMRDSGPDVMMLAGIVAALVALWKYHRLATAPFRWLWRKMWRDEFGRHNGPAARASALVRVSVAPLVDEVKVAARAQHDSQNAVLRGIADTLSEHGDRITGLEEAITNPPKRPTEARERSTD